MGFERGLSALERTVQEIKLKVGELRGVAIEPKSFREFLDFVLNFVVRVGFLLALLAASIVAAVLW